MSSFDYTDNFSGFNDLINRSEFLTEAKQSPYAKYHPSFGGVTRDLKSAGFSSAPLDTINFIRTALYNLELISDDELDAAKRGSGFSAKKKNLLALLDGKADVIEQNKDEIAKEIEDGLAQYINRATTNRGKEEKYAAQKAALELAKDIKAGEDVGDAVEDAVGQMDAAESELAQSLQMSKEDPTTFIEIKIRDVERVEDVGNIVSKYANEDGLDISGDTVQFSVDPDTPLAKAVGAHGIDKIEAALKRDVDKISDSVVVVMAPDEDYEDMYGMEGNESYAAQENEDNEPIDENEEGDKWIQGAVKDMKKKGTEGALTRAAKAAGESMSEYCASPPSELAKKRCQFRANVSDEEENELDHFLTKEQPEDYVPSTDYEDVLNDLVNKDKKDHAMKKLTSEDEEEFSYSPMLESHNTDTSAYLIEQAASDKRNKKTEVKPQSFKEKYKPKTHWQLEELRRYGL
jgi:hypothetical protein|tara:strand:- start:2482 stop:3864 length:1383 start_codon:yes stop_codon:yes gene_type:complete